MLIKGPTMLIINRIVVTKLIKQLLVLFIKIIALTILIIKHCWQLWRIRSYSWVISQWILRKTPKRLLQSPSFKLVDEGNSPIQVPLSLRTMHKMIQMALPLLQYIWLTVVVRNVTQIYLLSVYWNSNGKYIQIVQI